MKFLNYVLVFFTYKNREVFFILLSFTLGLIIFNMMIDDFFRLSDSFYLIIFKWIVNLIIFVIVGIVLFKMIKKDKKDEIKIKKNLTTRMDLIIKKYKKDL